MEQSPYILTYIKQGFGNRVLMLCNVIYLFLRINNIKKRNPENSQSFTPKSKAHRLYVAIALSHHDKYTDPKMTDIFPNLNNDFISELGIEFIRFKQYDEMKLKSEAPFLNLHQDDVIDSDSYFKSLRGKNILFECSYMFNIVPFMKFPDLYGKLFKSVYIGDSKEQSSRPKISKSDILMHVRFGDKYQNKKYITMNYKYYLEALKIIKNKSMKMRPKALKIINVYIATDSVDLVKSLILKNFQELSSKDSDFLEDFNFIFLDEPYWNVFYLTNKFSNVIVSESTLTMSSLLIERSSDSKIPRTVIAYKYTKFPDVNMKISHNFPKFKTKFLRVKVQEGENFKLMENPLIVNEGKNSYIVLDDLDYIN